MTLTVPNRPPVPRYHRGPPTLVEIEIVPTKELLIKLRTATRQRKLLGGRHQGRSKKVLAVSCHPDRDANAAAEATGPRWGWRPARTGGGECGSGKGFRGGAACSDGATGRTARAMALQRVTRRAWREPYGQRLASAPAAG